MATGTEITLIVLGVAAVGLLVALLFRLRMPEQQTTPAPDTRLDQVLLQLSALDERTKGLGELQKDVAALKDRTKDLPEKIQHIETQTQPIVAVATQIAVLPKIDRQLDELHGAFRSTKGRGEIGEDAVRFVLRQFPDDVWIEKPGLPGGTPDFGVRMPNGLILPIDSKTGGAEEMRGLLHALDAEEDAREGADASVLEAAAKSVKEARRAVGGPVRKEAAKIRKYIMPEAGTTSFVVQALPDAVYDALDPRIRQEASDGGVVPVPYGLLHATVSLARRLESHGEIDARKLSAAVTRVREASKAIETTVKNSVEKAATMATNAAQEIRTQLAAIQAALMAVEADAERPAEVLKPSVTIRAVED